MTQKNNKIALAAFGVENRAVYEYLISQKVKAENITIADNNPDIEGLPEKSPSVLGKDAFRKLKNFDLVFRSPPIRPSSIKTDGKVWSATNEFFEKCPAPIIGVTGTKGKGTTSTLIANILSNAGKTTHLLGNIGIPALSVLPKIKPDDIVVFELSSFQLWDLKKSPHVAVVLMVEPDHLDVHIDIEEYIEAKANIVRHQTEEDVVVRHPNNEMTSQVVLSAKPEKLSYMSKGSGAYIENDHVMIADQPIIAVQDIGLLGEHNLENVCAAVTAAWHYTQDTQAAQTAIKQFKGLPHRLQFVREVRGVKYYDDSQATGASSSTAALEAFRGKNRVLILGGSDKGTDVSKVLKELNSQDKIVIIGQATDSIADMCQELGLDLYPLGQDVGMKAIVGRCYELAEFGDIVLLSPAHASFDMFKSYIDRGNQFIDEVNDLPS